MKLRSEGKTLASPPESSQGRPSASASRERGTTTHGHSSRHKSPAGNSAPYATRGTLEGQAISGPGSSQEVPDSSLGLDESYMGCGPMPEGHPYTEPAQFAPYGSPAYSDYSQYAELSGYYPESSFAPSQNLSTESQFYGPGDALTRYDRNYEAASGTPFSHSDAYVSKQNCCLTIIFSTPLILICRCLPRCIHMEWLLME